MSLSEEIRRDKDNLKKQWNLKPDRTQHHSDCQTQEYSLNTRVFSYITRKWKIWANIFMGIKNFKPNFYFKVGLFQNV